MEIDVEVEAHAAPAKQSEKPELEGDWFTSKGQPISEGLYDSDDEDEDA